VAGNSIVKLLEEKGSLDSLVARELLHSVGDIILRDAVARSLEIRREFENLRSRDDFDPELSERLSAALR